MVLLPIREGLASTQANLGVASARNVVELSLDAQYLPLQGLEVQNLYLALAVVICLVHTQPCKSRLWQF